MTKITIEKLIWDSWNRKHIKKHGLSEKEVNEAGKDIVYHRKTYNKRYLAVGKTEDRLIAIVVFRKRLKTYYVVTARDASQKERKKVHDKEKKQNS